MTKRSILRSTTPSGTCKVCRTVRPFLIVALALIALLWSQPEWRLPSDYDYSTLVGDVFLVGCLLYVGWRVYEHRRSLRKERFSDDGAMDVSPVRPSRRRNRVAGDPRGWT